MPITPQFTQQDLRSRFDKFLEVVEKRAISRLQLLGEMCVIKARSIPASAGFTDRTGNLRSSIGYMVFKNGLAVHGGYEVVGQGAEGVNAGKALAKNVGSRYKEGLCLVVTAGMDYAILVESRGRDVLTSAESFASQEMPKMLEELKQNINKALS